MNDGPSERDVFFRFARELRDLAWEIHERREGGEDPGQLFELYIGMLEAFVDRAKQQERTIRYLRGEKVEPITHFAKVVVHGRGGGGL